MTPIYSPHFPIADNPLLATQRASRTRLTDTLAYPALPWQIEDLPGTEWMAVFTFRRLIVGALEKAVDNYGRLGYWHGERFVIEYWIRWDVLPPEAQTQWHHAHAAALATQVTGLQQELRDLDDHAPTPSAHRVRHADYKQKRLALVYQLDQARGTQATVTAILAALPAVAVP